MAVAFGGSVFTNSHAYALLEMLKTELVGPIDEKRASYGEQSNLADDVNFMSEIEVRRLDPTEFAGNGHTYTYLDEEGKVDVENVVIVVHDEFMDPKRVGEPADLDHFLDALFALFHELRHVEQALFLSREDTALGNLMFVANAAERCDKGYQDEIYFQDPAEVDAQHLALRRGYVFLSGLGGFDGVSAEECVLSYQERRNKNLSMDYIGKPEGGKYGFVEDVFDAYKASFIESVHTSRPRNIKAMLHGKGSLDRFFRRHPGAYIQFVTEKDGYKQLEMASAVYIDSLYDGAEPKWAARRREILRNRFRERGLDLSLDATFGKGVFSHFGSVAPQPGEYGDQALASFGEVMRHVEAQDLLTEREKESSKEDEGPVS